MSPTPRKPNRNPRGSRGPAPTVCWTRSEEGITGMERRKFLMTLAAVVALVVVGGGAYALTGGARRGTAVAASVNGEPIYWSQVDAEMKRTAASFGVDPNSPEFEKQKKDLE